jgi:hypothetical protein
MDFKATYRTTAAFVFIFALSVCARAQEEAPKFEVGAQFTSIGVNDDGSLVVPGCLSCGTFYYKGVGGRFTYNVNDHLAVETEVNFFLDENRGHVSRKVGGKPMQALFGVKAGKRFGRVGVFAKARPGVLSFSGAIHDGLGLGTLFDVRFARRTHFNLDVGGVFEVYPSRRVVLRVDAGDTIVRYGDERVPGTDFSFEGDTRHSFQFNTGVGFRF